MRGAVLGIAILLIAIWVAACSPTGSDRVSSGGGIYYWHDDAHGASCWTVYSAGISCLWDKP